MDQKEPVYQAEVVGYANPRLDMASRIVMFFGGLTLVSLLAIAGWLEPNPEGLGTHEQLGLPKCGFHMVYNIPCPACGMTTSWSWLVRANLYQAFLCNAGGLMLGLICIFFSPWLMASAIRGTWTWFNPNVFWIATTFITTGVVTVIHWIAKIYG